MPSLPLDPDPPLPDGWQARAPRVEDIDGLVGLLDAHRRATRGSAGPGPDTVLAEAVGAGSWTRRQVLALDPHGTIRAWATVHDRAARRTDVRLVVDPALTPADTAASIAAALLSWLEEVARTIATERGLTETQLDALVEEADTDQEDWLTAAGYRRTRRWLNMTRPVSPEERAPAPRDGVTIRRVSVQDLGDGTTLPVAEDLQAVHRVLEESFEDHFNSYRESFAEFTQRLREDPGHRWDHWWLALVEDEGQVMPGGALVSSVIAPDSPTPGTYLDYIGVHRRARGRGVAKSLLWTLIGDAAARGRNRVSLEVDADSPTGADGLYRSLGWATDHVTHSWHKDVPAAS